MITPTQSRMARAALGWSIAAAAGRAGVGKNTALRFEADGNVTTDTVRAILAAYLAAGIEFPDPRTVRHGPVGD